MVESGERPETPTSPETKQPEKQPWAVGAYLGMLDKISQIQNNPQLRDLVAKMDSARQKYTNLVFTSIALVAITAGIGSIEANNRIQSDTPKDKAKKTREVSLLPWEQPWQLSKDPQNEGQTDASTETIIAEEPSNTPQPELRAYHNINAVIPDFELNPNEIFQSEEANLEAYNPLYEKYGIPHEKAHILDQLLINYNKKHNVSEQIPLELIIVIGGIESGWTFKDVDHPRNGDGSQDFGPFGINSRFIKEDLFPNEKKWGREISYADAQDFEGSARWVIDRLYFIAAHDGLSHLSSSNSLYRLAKRYNGGEEYAVAALKRLNEGMPDWARNQK